MNSPGLDRVAWFDGQSLGADDFRTEQSYFQRLIEARNRALHSAGIARGLELERGPRNRSITISAGMALDEQGVPIVLLDARTVDLPADLQTEAYVLISAGGFDSGLTAESGAVGYKSYSLEPQIDISADGAAQGASHVVLGKLVLDERGAVTDIDARVRVYSSVRAGSVAFCFGDQADDTLPRLHARAESNAAILEVGARSTFFAGSAQTSGTLAIGRSVPHAQLDVLSDRPSVVSVRNDAMSLLEISSSGEVGIGVPQPNAALEVAGDIRLEATRRISLGADAEIRSVDQHHRLVFSMERQETELLESGDIELAAGSSAPPLMLYSQNRASIGGAPEPPLSIPSQTPELLSVKGRVRSLRGGFVIGGKSIQPTAGQRGTVRVGTVLDWWKPAGVELKLPAEYAICDGQVIEDQESPLFGRALPDLSDRFIRGTADYLQIGITGGTRSHRHTITELPRHMHGVAHDHGTTQGLSSESIGDARSHNGIDDKLSGKHHRHWVTVMVTATDRVLSEENTGFVDPTATTEADNDPNYYTLLKIMRIK